MKEYQITLTRAEYNQCEVYRVSAESVLGAAIKADADLNPATREIGWEITAIRLVQVRQA